MLGELVSHAHFEFLISQMIAGFFNADLGVKYATVVTNAMSSLIIRPFSSSS